jgi:TonB family protein
VFRLTALGGRLVAIGLSGAAHAAILLTPLWHRDAPGWTLTALPMAEVQVEPEPAPPPESLAPQENRATTCSTPSHPSPVLPKHDWASRDPSLVPVAARDVSVPKADTSTVLTANETATPRFTMVLSSGTSGAGAAASTTAASAGGSGDDDGSSTLAEKSVDTPARLQRGAAPNYPSEARAEGVEAEVKLELVVSATGVVENVRVVRRAGHGLDDAAVVAARQFRFSPAVKQGHAVRVRMSWSVEFRLD